MGEGVIVPWSEVQGDQVPDADGPTLGFDWLSRWQRHFGSAEDAVFASDAGVLPLTFERRKGARILRSFTNGHAQRSLAPGDPDGLLRALLNHPRWDALHLQGLPPGSARALIDAAQKRGLAGQVEHQFVHFFADLSTGPKPFWDGRSNSTFKRKAKYERAMSRAHDVAFHADKAERGIDRFFAAERASWKTQTGELLTANNTLEAFYRDLAASPRSQIYSLQSQDRLVAAYLTHETDREITCLKTFFADDFGKYSVGFVLMRRMFEHWFTKGFSGRVDLYTSVDGFAPFATGKAPFADVLIWAPTLRAGVLRRARSIHQALRR